MAPLPRFTLSHDENKNKWVLTHDRSRKSVKTFTTKAAATRGGALKKAVGRDGGSVKIQKVSGRYQEERTFPRSADPRRSKG